MRRTFFLMAAVALLLTAGGLNAAEAVTAKAQAKKQVIKIGVIFPLTGNNAYMGEMGKAGIELRLKELSGGSKFTYKVIYEDDGYVFSRTAMAVQRLKYLEHVDVLMTMWGYGSEIALPQLKDQKILHLNTERWSDANAKNDFVVGASRQPHVERLVELLKALHIKRVAFISTADQGAEALRKLIVQSLSQNGIELVENTSVSTEVRDLRTWILRVREAKPDLILNCAAMPVGQILMKQSRELGLTIPFGHITAAANEIEPVLKNGTWLINPSPGTAVWSEKFKSYFHKEGNYPAPQFYNTFSLLVNACERLDGNHKPTTAELSQSIEDLKEFEGATGTVYFVAPNRYEAPVAYYLFQNGQHKVISLEELVKFYKN